MALAATAALVVTGAVANGAGDRADHVRGTTTAKALKIVGQSTGGGCRMGYDTQTGTLIPPDDSTPDNAAAATVNLRKVCPGPVTAMFVSEVSTPGAGDFIHIDMRATCTGTGGMASPCTVGQQVFGSPGHTFMRHGTASVQTNSVQMVWTGLRRGLWRFEVLPGGNNSANLQFRSVVVEAFNAG